MTVIVLATIANKLDRNRQLTAWVDFEGRSVNIGEDVTVVAVEYVRVVRSREGAPGS